MKPILIAFIVLGFALTGAALLSSACAGIPEDCRPVCGDRESEACEQCLEEDEQRRREQRKERDERRRREPPPPPYPYPERGGTPGSY